MKIIGFATLLVLFCFGFVYSQEQVKNYTKVGQQMPAFSITDLDGKDFTLNNYKDKVIYVFFWATWCPYCQMEMPGLEKEIWQKYKSQDFAMIGIAREETKEQVSAFRKKSGFSFPLAADSEGEVFDLFANRGVPRSYIVDRTGKIIFQDVGFGVDGYDDRKEIIEKELKKIKKEKAGK